MSIHDKLLDIQLGLVATKDNRNEFAKFNYRSIEDITHKLKPLLKKTGCYLTLTDEIIEVGGRVYVKATATLSDGESQISGCASAREQQTKKGMDEAQITGAASSYARKYACAGLFAIDNNKDADSMDNSKDKKEPLPKPPTFNEEQKAAMDGWEVSGKAAAKNDAFASWWGENKKSIIKECSEAGAKLVHARSLKVAR